MPELVFAVVIDDALAFPSGATAPAPKRVLVYCRVPETLTDGEFQESPEPRWFPGKSLSPAGLEGLFAGLYGDGWRNGNSDGSRYVVQQVEMRAHRPDVAWEPPANTGSDQVFSRHYFLADVSGKFRVVTPAELVVPAR